MSGKWQRLGEQFGIPSHHLDRIRTRYSNPADGMKELIKLWLQQDYHKYSWRGLTTWSHVVLALKSPVVGESQLGEHLKQKYLPGELFDTSSDLLNVNHPAGCASMKPLPGRVAEKEKLM